MTVTLLELDPATLEANPKNVRKKTKDIDELAASIAKVGVLVPLIVRSNGNGHHVIVAGERRALAAVKAGVATVPAILHSYDDQGEAELTAMMVENLHREDLTPADEAKGYEQLAAFGITVDEIAQLTGRKQERVQSGLKVATSTTIEHITAKKPLTLEQLAGIVEVEDRQEDVDQLIDCAENEPEYFDHTLEQLRGERAARAATQAEIDKLTAAGVTILDKAPGYRFGSSVCRLDELADDKGKKLTTAGHKKCPGHAAFVHKPWQTAKLTVIYGCMNPKKNGHQALHAAAASSTSSAPKQSPADREKAAKEKASREELTQQLDVAATVRRKFLKDLLGRKSAPKGTLAFVVPIMVDDQTYLDDWEPDIVEQLMGVANPSSPFVVLAESAASDSRLQVVLLARVACSFENDISIESLNPRGPYQDTSKQVRYLQFLAACGYGLSEIEQKIVSAASAKKKA